MKRTLAVLAFALASAASTVHAQVGVYGKFDYTHFHDAGSNTSSNFAGGGVGIYNDFLHLGPLRLGADLRGDFGTGNHLHYRSILAGARLSGHAPVLPFRPYVQASIGAGGTQAQGPFAAGIGSAPYNNKFLYEILGGLDTTILPHVDFRAIEVGVGRESSVSSGSNSGASTLVLVSSGLVVRF